MWIPTGRPCAIAYLEGGKQSPCLRGTVKLFPVKKRVMVVADICGLPESRTGYFALHIHEGDSCRGTDFSESGGHYNPENMHHPNHAGDLPNLLSCEGRAFLAVLTDRITIHEVIGKTIIIHSDPDDYRTQPSGDPGTKIACGILSHC